MLRTLFAFQGRTNRRAYLAALALLLVVGIAAPVAIVSTFYPQQRDGGPMGFVILACGLALLWPLLALHVKRLHDAGRTGWMVMIAFLGIGLPGLILFCLILPGTKGPNRFGYGSGAAQAAAVGTIFE